MLIDTRELARTARTLEGELTVAAMPRLASLLARVEGQLHWHARGERRERPDGGHDDLLHLRLAADLWMQCVRCLADASVALRAESAFRLVASDEQAEREDLEDSEFDVLAGGPRFDLGALIEDEAIMALPTLARHEHCELPGAIEPSRPDRDDTNSTVASDSVNGETVANGETAVEAADDVARVPDADATDVGDESSDDSGNENRGDRTHPFADLAERMKRRH